MWTHPNIVWICIISPLKFTNQDKYFGTKGLCIREVCVHAFLPSGDVPTFVTCYESYIIQQIHWWLHTTHPNIIWICSFVCKPPNEWTPFFVLILYMIWSLSCNISTVDKMPSLLRLLSWKMVMGYAHEYTCSKCLFVKKCHQIRECDY